MSLEPNYLENTKGKRPSGVFTMKLIIEMAVTNRKDFIKHPHTY